MNKNPLNIIGDISYFAIIEDYITLVKKVEYNNKLYYSRLEYLKEDWEAIWGYEITEYLLDIKTEVYLSFISAKEALLKKIQAKFYLAIDSFINNFLNEKCKIHLLTEERISEESNV
jgi:hypothetical protein